MEAGRSDGRRPGFVLNCACEEVQSTSPFGPERRCTVRNRLRHHRAGEYVRASLECSQKLGARHAYRHDTAALISTSQNFERPASKPGVVVSTVTFPWGKKMKAARVILLPPKHRLHPGTNPSQARSRCHSVLRRLPGQSDHFVTFYTGIP